MVTRSTFVQLRVTPEEKARIRRLAESAGQDITRYILSRALPPNRLRFEEILRSLGEETDHRFVLAELNDLLTELAPVEFQDALGGDLPDLTPFLSNYVAAMVEQAARLKDVPPPAWTRSVPPLDHPYFASPLQSHRLHLLRASPVAFKRRNLFVDASVGARV